MSEISKGPGTGNRAPSLDQIDAEIAAEQARWDAEQAKAPPPAPHKPQATIQVIRPRFDGFHLVKVIHRKPATALIVFKLPTRARRRVPHRHAVQRAGVESGDSDGGEGGSSDSDEGSAPSLHGEAGQ
jgi:hypothetical protein